MCLLAFGGEKFLPEYSDDFDSSSDPETMEFVAKYKYSDNSRSYVHSGRIRSYSG